MNTLTAPTNLTELVEAVRSTANVVPVGARTKPRLSQVDAHFKRISLLHLRGIVEYQPDEYTITALAGTPLAEVIALLQKRGQYLPFDPLYVDGGSTVGGAIASGLNGPGRFRFGGCRDFILAVRFVDGGARLLRMGAKVVKNAAGFDIPKFLVGSLGRFGVIAEATFKVFPRPAASTTLQFPTQNIASGLEILNTVARGRWEADALDIIPGTGAVCVRLAAPAEALPALGKDLLNRWPSEQLNAEDAEAIWTSLRETSWAHPEGPLLKVPCSPATAAALWTGTAALEQARVHLSAAGNVAFVSLPSADGLPRLESLLSELQLPGLTLRGAAPLWLGSRPQTKIAAAVKEALDPKQVFPPLES